MCQCDVNGGQWRRAMEVVSGEQWEVVNGDGSS